MVGQPTKIGKYDVLRLIGRGGMGVVYEALDPKLERHVAIKMILGATPGLLARFDREARSTGSLQHQNIVTIYEFGDQEGSPYLVMEYLEGMSLDVAISSGRTLSLATKLSICVDVCNGLNYAHDRGIIHRDIKPGNVMLLEDGNVKIVDFGIARIGDTGISRTEVVGSLHYMSPEQFQSQPLDRRTDIFSTGVVLYQMLTGILPFQATGGEAAVMYRIIHEDPAPLSGYLHDYPPQLDEILRKALAKNRDLRYSSARDLAFDLLAVMEKEKHQEVLQWMKRADMAMQRAEWAKAEDCLRQALKVDKHHTPAHQLLNQVQVRVREQRKVDQIRQLRIQADEAFLDRRYDEALRTVDQAVAIDDTNKDLLSLREAIQEAKSRAARLKMALHRAEEAHRAGDLDEAKLAVRDALEIDPSETSAKVLQVVILKQAEEQERQHRLRTLFDNARDQIGARNLTGAFQTLKEAEQLDSSSVELYSLMKVVSAAREEQFRKMELDKLTREIEEALNREDYRAAAAIANEGLQRHPREQGLLRLKALAETQDQRAQLKAYARDQFLAANGLLEAGRTSEALSAIENALRTIPEDTQLERLRDIVKHRLAADEADNRKRQLLGRAQEMAAAEKFDDAVGILESVRRDFSGTEEIGPLLERVRAAANQAKAVSQALDRAQQLLHQGNADQAVQFLEDRTLELSDARLFDLLESARRQREQFRSSLRTTVEEGNGILKRQGALEAARYLGAQPAKFRDITEFRALAEVVANRVASEALDQELLLKSDPDAQVRLAEGALRANPANDEIRKRCAVVRNRKEQIDAIGEKAHLLESLRRYADAAKELQQLRQLHPEYPSLEAEIRRLERLEEQSLSEAARREVEQFRQAVQSAIDEGKRVLQSSGAREAARYLGTQPAKYRDILEFRAFSEFVVKRIAWEALDQALAGATDLDAQIRLAETALRESSGNEEIVKRLAALRSRKEHVSAIAERARVLEASRQFGKAATELQQLCQLYPQHPNLEPELQRLERLEERRSSDDARREREQFQSALQTAIAEGHDILQRQGALEAARYLGTQPAKLREVPEFQALADAVADRVAIETLDQSLSRKSDPDVQVRVAEAALRENPRNEEIKKRLLAVRSRQAEIAAILEKARVLEASRLYREAASELHQLRPIHPQHPNLESEIRRLDRLEEQRLSEDARRQLEQFRSAVQSAIDEGNRVLKNRGALEAERYLATQPPKYRETPEFRTFAEMVSSRIASEGLEQALTATTDLDAQLRLGESALRENPGNQEINKRLAAIRGRKEQVNAITEKAHVLEASRRYGKAAKELQRLRETYPQYPNLESEIRRLEGLDQPSKQPQRNDIVQTAMGRTDRPVAEQHVQDIGATVIMGRPHLEGTRADVGSAQPIARSGEVQSGELAHVSAPPDPNQVPQLSKAWLIAGVAIVVVVGAGLVYRFTKPPARAVIESKPANVLVKIDPVPEDSTLRVDGKVCPAPCQILLLPGSHRVDAEHDGYTKLAGNIQVERGASPDFPLMLSPIETPRVDTAIGDHKGTTPSTPRELERNAKGRAGESSTVEKKNEPMTPAAEKVVITNAKTGEKPSGPSGEPPKAPTPSPSGSFELNRKVIERGESAELSWNIQNSTSVKLDGQPVNAIGSKTVTPIDSTTYHLTAVGLGGAHDFDKDIVVNVPATKPKTDTATLSEQDQTAIRDLLQRYAGSFEHKDAKILQDLWPGIPKEKLKVIKESYKVNARVTFSNLQYIHDPDGRVRVLCSQTNSSEVRPQTTTPFTVTVNQKSGRWVIDYIPIQ